MFGGCGTAANAAIQRHDHDTEKRTARATFHVRDKAIQARESLSTAEVFGLIRPIQPRSKRGFPVSDALPGISVFRSGP